MNPHHYNLHWGENQIHKNVRMRSYKIIQICVFVLAQTALFQTLPGLSKQQNDFQSNPDRWLWSFQTGIPGTVACVFQGIPLTLSTHTVHTLHTIAVSVSLTHTYTSNHKPTLQNKNIWCCIPITHNSGIRLGSPSHCRPRPELRRSRCRDSHAQERWEFRDEPVWFDCTALMWITINTLSCPVML